MCAAGALRGGVAELSRGIAMTRQEWRAIERDLRAAGHYEAAILAAWHRALGAGVSRADPADVVRSAVARELERANIAPDVTKPYKTTVASARE